MTSDHTSGRPILRRIFAATRRREGVGSTTASFHSCKSISITHVESRWIIVNGGTSDGPEFKEGYQIEDIEGAEDIPANDDDSQFEEIECVEDIPASGDDIHRQFEEIELIEGAEDIPANDDDSPTRSKYQFDNCNVFINSFNARGVKVKNSGNNAPRVTYHGDTVPNEGLSLSTKLSRPCTRPKGPRHPAPALGQSSPPLLSQLREDNSSHTSDDSPGAPPVCIGIPFPTFEEKQSTKRDKLPATVEAKSMQSNQAPTTLPGSKSGSQPHPINPFLPMHMMGLHPNLLSHILQPFPDDAPNSWNDRDLPSSTCLHPHHHPAYSSRHHGPDTNPKSLKHHLDSALEILIQTSGVLADDVTPQARNTLKAINALVSESIMETPAYDLPPRFKSVRIAANRRLQIPRSQCPNPLS